MKELAFVMSLGMLCVSASAAAQELANPFAPPALVRSNASDRGETSGQASPTLELRATLVRGRQSSANIGGTIVRVGTKIGDYRLISVHEGAAVLVDAAGVTHVLEIEPSRQVAP